jgi:hypothetical protein
MRRFDACPDSLDYYYKQAAPTDRFVNTLSGLGHIHEDEYANGYPLDQQGGILKDYIRLCSDYVKRIDA